MMTTPVPGKPRRAFFAYGTPKGQPRPRAFSRGGRGGVYDPGTANEWKAAIANYLPPSLLGRIDGPIAVGLSFRLPRPRAHYVGKSQRLRADAPVLHTSKPDIDNLIKAVLDVLSRREVWVDDDQVAWICAEKRYADTPESTGCWIVVKELFDGADEADAV